MFEVLGRNKEMEDGHLMMSSIYEWHFQEYTCNLLVRSVKIVEIFINDNFKSL